MRSGLVVTYRFDMLRVGAEALAGARVHKPMQREIAEGQVLAGKYRVERVLGRGGMGIVVAAHHLQLDEKVAIKFLLPEAVSNAEVIGRFVREARAAGSRASTWHVCRMLGPSRTGRPTWSWNIWRARTWLAG